MSCYRNGFSITRGGSWRPLIPVPPVGKGRIARHACANPERLNSSRRGMRCSLSLRERARVRGNETQPAKRAGRSLQAQLHRLPDSELSCQARFVELSRLNWWENQLLQPLRRQTHIKCLAVRNLISWQRPSSPSFAAATKMKMGLAIRIRFCYMSLADPESTR